MLLIKFKKVMDYASEISMLAMTVLFLAPYQLLNFIVPGKSETRDWILFGISLIVSVPIVPIIVLLYFLNHIFKYLSD